MRTFHVSERAAHHLNGFVHSSHPSSADIDVDRPFRIVRFDFLFERRANPREKDYVCERKDGFLVDGKRRVGHEHWTDDLEGQRMCLS